ncbi:PLP-dependent transferase, partial [Virgibacillus sp. 7505]
LSPFEAWLACRGLKTLALRMERQCQNAAELATTMQETDGVKHVYYPPFVSEKGNGAIVSIELDQKANVERFFSAFTFVKVAPTLA